MAQFTLYNSIQGPNGWTVVYLLKALGLSYELKNLDIHGGEHKTDAFLRINPNGRISALVDHGNNDFTVWESKACLLYLAEKYDSERRFTPGPSVEEQATLLQWLFFQASGQGAYFGQYTFFAFLAPSKIFDYAIKRYQAEVLRVLGVLEAVLAAEPADERWLVGGKVTIADLAFVSWNTAAFACARPQGTVLETDFPAVAAWHAALTALPFVREGVEKQRVLVGTKAQ
ncbi:hypothetical protein JCM10207_007247 [Rhodosporidiobolus poonsookiae]